MANRTATPHQILEIRSQADGGVLNVRAWADVLRCSPETVRRYARRDTARQLTEGGGGRAAATLEPDEAAIQASLHRLTEMIPQSPARKVDDLLAELTQKGKRNDESRE